MELLLMAGGAHACGTAGLEIRAELVDGDGEDDGDAEDQLGVFFDDVDRGEAEVEFADDEDAVFDELEDEHAEDGTESGAAAAGEAGAADDGGGDDVNFIAFAGVGSGGFVEAAVEHAGDTGAEAGEGVDAHFDGGESDAAEAGGFFVTAQGVGFAAPDGVAEIDPADGEADEHDEDGDDAEGFDELAAVAGEFEFVGDEVVGEGGGQGAIAEGLGGAVEDAELEGNPTEDAEGGEGHDEGVHAEADDGDAVEEAAEEADAECRADADEEDDEGGGVFGQVEQREGGDEGGEAHDGADGDVDAAGDDDDGFADGHDGHPAHDGEDAVDDVGGAEEAVFLDDAEGEVDAVDDFGEECEVDGSAGLPEEEGEECDDDDEAHFLDGGEAAAARESGGFAVWGKVGGVTVWDIQGS